ncbi:hypothetical protein AZ34_11995 [Hylemonella gracilis str. Niagara R]|uniref:Uncharacterized protein n=1 Tax=Hylemonella gracilis str. Niagara R TaxID=1458275 RepID=A0A016XMT8_9BURK|nr:hypothetical protein [Hylemonella gracilis]EYC52897.1 hypothetical protein AZ34_11995 [Hylemonella gracilis str. Niagara R]
MSAPAHVRYPLHASTVGVQFGVDIKDANGMLVGCVLGLTDVMLPTARAMAAGPALLKLAERVARLNRDADEIGAGMLAGLVDDARELVAQASSAPAAADLSQVITAARSMA